MDEVLAGSLLNVIVEQGNCRSDGNTPAGNNDTLRPEMRSSSQKVFQGGNRPRFAGKYTPVLEKPRMDSVEKVNARWAKRMGFEQQEKVKEKGFRTIWKDPSGYDAEQPQGCI